MFLWLPEERILATGDIVVRPTPYGFYSYPRSWAAVLRELKGFDARYIVPGHGDVMTDTGYLDLLGETMELVATQVDAQASAGKSLDETRAAMDWSSVEERFTGGDAMLAFLFNVWFKTPIIEAQYNLSTGKDNESLEASAEPGRERFGNRGPPLARPGAAGRRPWPYIARVSTFAWILSGGLLMSAIALIGSVTTVLQPATLERLLLPLVALAAGTLLGGALFHLIPEGMSVLGPLDGAVWILAGFMAFLVLEQFLHRHHDHRTTAARHEPVTYLILLGDALHNFLGGLAIGSAFITDPRVGMTAWLAAAAHEVPQELGDFGVLVHGGWTRRRALLWNLASGLTFLLGALLAFAASFRFDVTPLLLFGAGNFIYIGASDLVPEIKSHPSLKHALVLFGCFAAGALALLALAYGLRP
jgi:zinc and cadmium transporter